MTAPAVLAPTTPSAGPELKPNDCSLAWTSLTSSRRSGVRFGGASTDAGCPVPTESRLTSGAGWADVTLGGGGRGVASVGSTRPGMDGAVATLPSAGDAGCVGSTAPDGDPTVGRRVAMPDPTIAPRAKPTAT